MRPPLLLVVFLYQVLAHDVDSETHTVARNARQYAPQPPTAPPATSSINWWPYPSYSQWGQNTAALITSPASPTSIPPLTSLNAVVSLTSDMGSLSAPPLAESGSSAATTPVPTSSVPATSANTSMTTITALPPAKTPSRKYKRPGAAEFNIVYLAPLFAFLGVVFGSFCTWLFFHLYDRRRQSREPGFKPGPAYAPSDAEGSIPPRTSEANSAVPFLGERRPSSRFVNGEAQRDEAPAESSWLARAFSAHRREPAAHSRKVADQIDDSVVHDEDDPFLAPPSHSQPNRVPSRRVPTPAGIIRSPDALSEDEELDNTPWDTLRHKSIRRGILERLQYGSRYRKGHQRSDSDVTVEQAQKAQAKSKYLSVPGFEESPSRGRSTTRGQSSSLATPSGSSGPGFRIVEEDPDSGVQTSLLGWSLNMPWNKSGDHLSVADNLTALPARRSSADKRRSPSPSPRTFGSPVTPTRLARPRIARVDSSVLPMSPPQVMSPPLEAELFFGGPTPKLDLSLHSPPYDVHTQRAPPLPFPSSKQYEQRPTRSTKTSLPPVVRVASSKSSYSAVSRAQSPAERHARRHGALNKVDQILAESWSARDLRGAERVRSPTMFGAVLE